ncbi:nitroreductase [Virgibacillus byunsanensis]|uniref:Putative NAD(P)H nitroreductase n=1 Tax=Virgibacillus byunsanensis TaxID=570945 RepID=A0ABW3LIV9_9BACI
MKQTKNQTELAKVIRERRSVKKNYSDQTVTDTVVLGLLEDAKWAPTHGLRQPWRFLYIGEDQLGTFAKSVASTYPEEKQVNREEYLNEPSAILVVIMDEPDNQKQWDENFGATACMIQNFQLLAWEKQLGVVWKTNPHIYDPHVKELLKVNDSEKIVGFLHLGYFDEPPIKKDRISISDKFSIFQG